MPITRVQSQVGSTVGLTAKSVAATWSPATTSGNFLLAGIAFGQFDPGAITPPANWVQVGSTLVGSSSLIRIAFFIVTNAASQSGAQTWNWVNNVDDPCVVILEYSGIDTVSPQDTIGSAVTNTSSSPSGIAVTTTNAQDLVFAFTGEYTLSSSANPNPYSSPTGGFSLVTQRSQSSGSGATLRVITMGYFEQIVAATATYTSGCT